MKHVDGSAMFSFSTRSGRVAVVLEADDEEQASRRGLWLRSAIPSLARTLGEKGPLRWPRSMPIPRGVVCVYREAFEEVDVY